MTSGLALANVHKRFAANVAVDDASLTVEPSEIHALVGENGAGKSTLMRILAGVVRADRGEVRVFGEGVPRGYDARGAIARGVGMVHQHFLLAPTLSVAENVVFGREPRRGWFFDRARAEREVAELSERYGLRVTPRARVGDLSVGEAQRVEILKVLYRGARGLVLDEPTAVLSPPEVQELWRVLRGLRAAGAAIVLVTHKLAEVVEVSDRVTVMRAGRTVLTTQTSHTTPEALARAMVGHDVDAPSRDAVQRLGARGDAEIVLAVRGLHVAGRGQRGGVRGAEFSVRAGEVLGVAGVEGNGQAELCDAIAGLRRPQSGDVLLRGRAITREAPRTRRDAGLRHVPADRHARGLVLEMTLAENLILGRQHEVSRAGTLDPHAIEVFAREQLCAFDVRPALPTLAAGALSGGNQQKLVMARELFGDWAALVASHPTRGVDIGAAARIHEALFRARDAGKAILLVSSELSELLLLSDRIVTMFDGRVAGELTVAEARAPGGEARIGRWMMGVEETAADVRS